MKSWSMFAITPAVLVAAYLATPIMLSNFTGHNAAPVVIAPLDLPVAANQSAKSVNAAGLDINYAVFGRLSNSTNVKPKPEVMPEFVLQSVLMTDRGSYAVIDGKVVHRGSKVGSGFRVTRIMRNEVLLAGRGTKKVLHFPVYRDADLESAKQAAKTASGTPGQAATQSGQSPDQAALEQKYKQILEALPKL